MCDQDVGQRRRAAAHPDRGALGPQSAERTRWEVGQRVEESEVFIVMIEMEAAARDPDWKTKLTFNFHLNSCPYKLLITANNERCCVSTGLSLRNKALDTSVHELVQRRVTVLFDGPVNNEQME